MPLRFVGFVFIQLLDDGGRLLGAFLAAVAHFGRGLDDSLLLHSAFQAVLLLRQHLYQAATVIFLKFILYKRFKNL